MSDYEKILDFIRRGEALQHTDIKSGMGLTYVTGQNYDAWMSEIKIFNDRALINHPLHNDIFTTCFHRKNIHSYDDMMGYLRALANDKELFGIEDNSAMRSNKTIDQMLAEDIDRCEKYLEQPSNDKAGQMLYVELTGRYDSIINGFGNGLYQYFAEQHFYDPEVSGESLLHNLRMLHGKMLSYQATRFPPIADETPSSKPLVPNVKDNKKIFIVHGHDNEAKQELARVLEKSGFEAIILHEQPTAGKTIIEKIERFTDVSYAIVLYTECDMGRDKTKPVDQEQFRARQNVVFEHGYLISKLGRDHVCALVKGDVETPGDISGVIYIPMDENGAWKMQVAIDMQDVGLSVDMNKFCR